MKKHALTLSILLLSGCSSGYRVPFIVDTSANYASVHYGYDTLIKTISPFSQATPHINPHTFNPSCADENGLFSNKNGTNCRSFYAIAMDSTADAKDRILKRDALIEALLGISEEATSIHHAGIQATQTNTDLLIKLGDAGSAAASGAVSSAATKGILGAVTSGSNATQLAISDEVYQQQIAGNINNLMTQEREKKRLEIRNSLAKKNAFEYSAERGITDVLEYHEAGSFYKALETINAHLAKSVDGNKDFTDDTRGNLNIAEEIKSAKITCENSINKAIPECLKWKTFEADRAAENKTKLDAELAKLKAQADEATKKVNTTQQENSEIKTSILRSQTIGGTE